MSQPSIRVTYEDHDRTGRYVVRVDGVDGEGELIISKVSDGLIRADHTLVPEAMRGTGAASALVNRLIADARVKGLHILPLRPYVRAQSLRHPERADVIQH